MGDYSVEIGYSLDLSHIRKGVDEFNKLSIEVGSVSKQIDSISDSAGKMIKSLSNAASSINSTKETVAGVAEAVSKVNKTVSDLDNQSGSNKKTKAKTDVEAIANASKSASDKIEAMIEKFNLMYAEMSKGSKRSEAAILSTITMLGATDDQMSRMTKSLNNLSSLLKDPFDDSLGAIRSLNREFEELETRVNLAKSGIVATKSQMSSFSRIPNEVKAKFDVAGISTETPEGFRAYSEQVSKTQNDAIDIIKKSNEILRLEKERNEQTKLAENLNKTLAKREKEIIDLVKSINSAKVESYNLEMSKMREFYLSQQKFDSDRKSKELENFNAYMKFKNEQKVAEEENYRNSMSNLSSYFRTLEKESGSAEKQAKVIAKSIEDRKKLIETEVFLIKQGVPLDEVKIRAKHSILGIDKSITDELVKQINISRDLDDQTKLSNAKKNVDLRNELSKIMAIVSTSKSGVSVQEARLQLERQIANEMDDENEKLRLRISQERQSLKLIEQYQNLVNSSNRRKDENDIMKKYDVSRSNAGLLFDIKATGDIELFNKTLKVAQSEMQKTMFTAKGFSSVLRGFFPSIGAGTTISLFAQAIRKTVELADSYRLLEQRIKMVTSTSSDYHEVVREIEKISARNGVALAETAKVYTRLVPAMESFKLQFKGIKDYSQAALKVTNAFSSSLKISNSTTQESASAMLQFSQAMQSGKLAGDEFRAITEAAPALLNAIAEGSGYARSELKAMSSEGKLTTEFISNALLKVEEDLQNKASKVPLSLGQSFENLVSKIMIASGEVNKATGIIDGMVKVMDHAGVTVESFSKIVTEYSKPITKMNEEIRFTNMTFHDFVKIGVLTVGSMAAVGLGAKLLAAGGIANLIKATQTLRDVTVAANIAFLSNPITLALTAATLLVAGTVGYLTFKYLENEAQTNNSIEAQKKYVKGLSETKTSIELLSKSIPTLTNSWKEFSKNSPQVSEAIDKMFSPENFDFRLLTDEQRRNLKEQSDFIQGKYKDLSYYRGIQGGKGFSTEERTNATVQIARINNEIEAHRNLQDALFDSYILRGKLDQAKGASEGYNQEIAKMNKEIETYTKVNKLIREGLGLKEAQNRVNAMTLWDESNPIPKQKEWQSPEQFNLEMRVYEERKKAAQDDIVRKTSLLAKLQNEQDKLTEKPNKGRTGGSGSGGKSDAEKFSEEIKQLEKLIAFTEKYGDVERARKAILGANVEDYDKFVKLTKQLENTKRGFEVDKEIENTSKINDLLKIGYSSEQASLMAKLQSNEITKSLYDKEVSLLKLKAQQDDPSVINENLNKQIELLSKGYSVEEQTTLEKYKQFYLLQGMSEVDATNASMRDLEVTVKKNEELEKAKESIKIIDDIIKQQSEYEINPFKQIADFDFSQFGAIGDSFGKVAESISAMTDEMNKYRDAIVAAKDDKSKLDIANKMLVKSELKGVGSVLSATKGFFNEKSKAYKALNAAEKVYKAFELASTIYNSKVKIAAILQEGFEFAKMMADKIAQLFIGTAADTTSTGIEVANASARATAKGTESVVNAGKDLPTPFNFAAMAAMTAAVVALGVSLSGGGGGSSVSTPSKASLRGEGFGTSLGVKDKASESIVNSISALESLQDKHLNVSGLMLNQLVLIKDGIAGFTSSIFQFTQLTGAKVKSISIPEFSLNNLGNVEVSSKAGGESTSYQFNQVFEQFLTSTVKDIVGVINNASVLTGNAVIGLEDSLIEIPKIYAKGLKKLKGAELTDRLTAIVGLIGDTITQQAFSTEKLFTVTKRFNSGVYGVLESGTSITETQYNALSERMKRNIAVSYTTVLDGFQRAGEGLLETLSRVSSGVDEANYELKLLGIQAINYTDIINKQGDVGAEIIKQSILLSDSEQGIKDVIGTLTTGVDDIISTFKDLTEITNGLIAAGLSASNIGYDVINGAGGIDRLKDGLDGFFENMLNPVEKYNEVLRRTQSDFAKIGLQVPSTVTAFKELVGAIELSGNKTQLGALLALTDDWWNLVQAQEEALSYSGKSLSDAEDLLRQVYEDERDKLESLIKTFTDIATELKKYRESLALSSGMLSPEEKLLLTQSTYRTNLNKAMTGDSEALKSITSTSKEYLDAAKDYFASGSQYFDVFNEVNSGVLNAENLANSTSSMYTSQLDALKALVGGYIDISENTTTIEDAIAQFLLAQSVTANPTLDNGSLNNVMTVLPSTTTNVSNITTPPVIVVSNTGNGVSLSGVEQRIDTTNEHAAALVVVQQEANLRILERLSEIEDKLITIENAARLEMVR